MDTFICDQCKERFVMRKKACPYCGGQVYPVLDHLYTHTT